jgi:hypothetical protein
LWGYDIAHANQRDGAMWPHNFNIVYRWSHTTASLLRDWFLLQVPPYTTARRTVSMAA